MPKQVVQVARDSLALSERGKALDLLVRTPQPALGPLALGVEDARGADHDREDECRRVSEEAPGQRHGRNDEDDADKGDQRGDHQDRLS